MIEQKTKQNSNVNSREGRGMAGEKEKLQILTWFIGKQLFGMELSQCREVVQDRIITRVPYANQNVAGIVNLRGEVVTVLDLSLMLGYESDVKDEKYVVVRIKSDTEHVAVKADTIYDILEVEYGSMESAPAHLNEMETRYIRGVAMTDKGLVVVLNADELLKSGV